MTPEEREDAALRFVDQHGSATYRQIADHLTEVTGVKHTRNMVAGILSRVLRRKQKAARVP